MNLHFSELDTEFSWDICKPFQISPQKGVLGPKSSVNMNATFCPTFAHVYTAIAVCTYGTDIKAALQLDGVGMLSSKFVIMLFCVGPNYPKKSPSF